tara:strand:- start:31 stop:258 length:228 start_codon:yes stop_codon:yes gene_type:complete
MKDILQEKIDKPTLHLAWSFLSSSQELRDLLLAVDVVPEKSHLRDIIYTELGRNIDLVERYFDFTQNGEKNGSVT